MKWENVNQTYQKLPLSCDTAGKRTRKETMEVRTLAQTTRGSSLLCSATLGPSGWGCPEILNACGWVVLDCDSPSIPHCGLMAPRCPLCEQKELAQLEKSIKMLSRPVVMVEVNSGQYC